MDEVATIPNLYISDVFVATNSKLLAQNKITHILTIAQPIEVRSRAGTFNVKQITVDDDPSVDILTHLKDVFAWIDEALRGGGKVLMHCRLGQSRSGAFLVGYLMKKLQLSYAAGLQLAREGRPMISPNPGFEKQLRIWEFCEYEVFWTDGKSGDKIEKTAYRAWKREMESLKDEDKEKARVSALANMAAAIGRRRREDQASNSQNNETKEKQWQNVENQERMWNDRLIRGQATRASPNDTESRISSLAAALGMQHPSEGSS